MRRLARAVVAAGLVATTMALSGCGDGETARTTAPATSPSPATTGPATVTAAPAGTVATTDSGSPPSRSTCTALTDRTTEGPYYVSGTAEVPGGALNAAGLPGEPIAVAGYVYAGAGTGEPLAEATVEVWQADGDGRYWPQASGSAAEYAPDALRLRGYVTTGDDGFYRFTTIVPGEYGGRARHIHVRATSADETRDVVTQLILDRPGDRTPTASDPIAASLDPCHRLRFDDVDGTQTAYFDIHL